MPSTLQTLAGAVTTLINENQAMLSAAFVPPTPTFAAQRVFLPNYELEQSPGLQVFVLGLGQSYDVKGGTRAGTLDTYTIKVAIYRQIDRDGSGQPDGAQMDGMTQFVQAVIDLLKANKFIDQMAAWQLIENEPVYDPVSLDQKNTFVSVISISYEIFPD